MRFSYTAALAILVVCDAAPVTIWQTATAITNSDGALFSWSPLSTSVALAVSNPTAVTSAATSPQTAQASPAAMTPTSSGQNSLMQGIADILSGLRSMLSPSSTSSTSSSSSSTSSTGGWRSLLGLILNGLSDSQTPSTTTPSTVQSYVPAFSNSLATSSASTSIVAQASPVLQVSQSSSSSTSASATSTSSGTSSSNLDQSFASAILNAHNIDRAAHGVGPLSWDNAAYAYAQNNANNYDCSGVLTHTHGPYGENLAAGFADGPSAVKAWYDEGQTYNYQTHDEYNHFTQVIWKGSTGVGCAYKDCRAQNWGLYVVCDYSPPGNVVGQLPQNVLPPI